MRTVAEADDERLPSDACFACQAIIAQLQAVQMQITGLDKRIHQAHRVPKRRATWPVVKKEVPIATSSAARSTPVCPPLMISMAQSA
jgi:hypothetical protein